MKSLRNKLWISFGGLLLILLIVSAMSIIVFTRYSRALERVFRENYDSAVYSDGMKQSLDELNLRAQRMIWDTNAPHTDPTTAEERFESLLNRQQGNIYVAGEADATQQLGDLWRQFRTEYDAFEPTPAKALFYDQRLFPRYKRLKELAQHISDLNINSMISIDGQAKITLLAFRKALLVLVIVGSLLAGVVVWTAGLSILKPLNELTASAKQIESGNLDLNLPMRSHDEIGQLAEAFNSMALRLREFKQLDLDRLSRVQQTTQLAIDSLPEAVFVIGNGGVIEISNHYAKTHFGIEPGRAITDLNLKWLPPLYEEVTKHRRPVEPQGYSSAVQLFVDNDERFLLPRAVPMLDSTGRSLGVTAILADVTQLRRVDEAKSNLISTVSHELRTPLTSQRLVLGLLISSVSAKLTANQQRLLSVAKADGDRLFRTIEDLLSISRMESGRAQFHFESVGPEAFLTAKIEPLRELFASKPIDLAVNLAPNLPPILIDRVAFGSAITNLLSNALKFTPADGSVTLTATHDPAGTTIVVADTGPGIPEEYRNRIFEKFFRVPNEVGPSGAGLGLAITKDVVTAHGGTIDFRCPAAGGTVFTLTLPPAGT